MLDHRLQADDLDLMTPNAEYFVEAYRLGPDDAAAGNANMINKMGGIPATEPGVTEFRYVDRKKPPSLSRGDHVTFDVVRAASPN